MRLSFVLPLLPILLVIPSTSVIPISSAFPTPIAAAQEPGCAATFAIATFPCSCGDSSCIGSAIVLPHFGFGCLGCRFSIGMVTVCSDPSCSSDSYSSTETLTCGSSERHSLACPAAPFADIVTVQVQCGQCGM